MSVPRRFCPALRPALTALLLAAAAAAVPAATPEQLLAAYSAQAGQPGVAERGRQFYSAERKNEFGWNCSTCHGKLPTTPGKHELTEKRIAPLAPAFAPERFTDLKHADGWFRTNCKDVLGRDCTAQEKADLLAWLLTLKP